MEYGYTGGNILGLEWVMFSFTLFFVRKKKYSWFLWPKYRFKPYIIIYINLNYEINFYFIAKTFKNSYYNIVFVL